MTAALTTARTAVVDELEAVFPGRKVYDWLPPSPVLPCLIVSPDDPPLELSSYGTWRYRLRVHSLLGTQVAAGTGAALEDDLEALIAWAGDTSTDHNLGPAKYGDATVYAAGLTITRPVNIPQE